jgi:hypothetical protein
MLPCPPECPSFSNYFVRQFVERSDLEPTSNGLRDGQGEPMSPVRAPLTWRSKEAAAKTANA